MNLSAKDLCSRSCMQIKMFIEHPELKPQPTFNQLEGEAHHHEVASKLKDIIGEEMGSHIWMNEGEDINIWFSNDILCKKGIIEVKHVKNDRDTSWFFQCSCVQCAVYSVLSKVCKYELKTAKFYVNKGNQFKAWKYVDYETVPYYLYFGDEIYRIDVTDEDKILEFIKSKAAACSEWETAKAFDKLYKHVDWKTLSPYFNIVRVR